MELMDFQYPAEFYSMTNVTGFSGRNVLYTTDDNRKYNDIFSRNIWD